jgi:hypothetical protein
MMARLREIWQRPLVRKIAAIVIFLAAVSVQVFFKNFPWPMSLESTDKLKSPSVSEGAQELVLSRATLKPKHLLLSYKSSIWETADLDLTRAKLDEQSAGFLALSRSGPPPSAATSWAYVTQRNEFSQSGNPCRMGVDIDLAPGSTDPGEFHFWFRLERAEASSARRLELRADNARLQVLVYTDQAQGPLCIKTLQAGSWQGKAGNIPLTFLVEPGSSTRITFLAESDKPPSWQQDGWLRMEFGPLSASQFVVRQVQEDGTPERAPAVLRFGTFREKPITVTGMALGSDGLQVKVGGRAWAWQDGKPVGFDVIDAMQKNLEFGAVLLGGNALFLAWLKKLFFGTSAAAQTAAATSGSSDG